MKAGGLVGGAYHRSSESWVPETRMAAAEIKITG